MTITVFRFLNMLNHDHTMYIPYRESSVVS